MTDRETIIRINEERRDRLSEHDSRVIGWAAVCLALVGALIMSYLADAK